jgi:hypothetical protein
MKTEQSNRAEACGTCPCGPSCACGPRCECGAGCACAAPAPEERASSCGCGPAKKER